MFASIRRFLAPPVFEGDDDKTRKAAFLNTILQAGFVIVNVYLIALPIFFPTENPIWTLLRYPMLIGSWVLMRKGYVRAACIFFVSEMWVMQLFVWGGGGGLQPFSIAGVVLRVMITGLLLGGRMAFLFAALSLIENAVIIYTLSKDYLPHATSLGEILVEQAIWSFLAAVLLTLWTSNLNQALRRARDELAERRRVEDQLRATEERFSKAFKASPNPMSIMTPIEGCFIEVNEAFLATYGYRREEVIGRIVADLNIWVNPADRTRLLEEIQTKKSVRNIETACRMKNGEERVMLISSEVIELDGEPCVLAVSSDITERKHAEEALRASEERFSKAFQASPLPMGIGKDGCILAVNDSLLRISGYTREEMVGRSAVELDLYPDLQDPIRMRRAIAETGAIRDMEIELRMKNGEVRPHLVSAEIIELGGEQCVLLVGNDITERKQAEEKQAQLQKAIQESAMEWRRTFDSVETSLLILDLDGRIIRLNRAARELSGLNYEEISGRAVASVAGSQPWQEAAVLVSRVCENRSPVSSQVRDESSGTVWEITATRLSGNGFDERIIIVARDITATVKLQESLRRSETMSAMGTLVAGVAHEVRNPLFSISATLDAFEARFGLREEYQQYVKVLRGELKRLNDLMRDLLEYGKPLTLELSEGSISDVAGKAIRSCEALVKRSQVRIVNHVGNDLPPIPMDRRRIAQVFQNVIQNAIQHSAAGTSVTVEAEPVCQGGALWVHCRVTDNGPGFRAEELPKIFEPFFTRRRGGTGIGLSIVQRIMEEHGGRVSAANRPEGGATVELRFRAGEPVAAGREVRRPEFAGKPALQ